MAARRYDHLARLSPGAGLVAVGLADVRRAFLGEPCCNGNRECLGRSFSRDSIILWVLRTHAERRREFRELLPAIVSRGAKVVILRTPKAAEQWIRDAIRAGRSSGQGRTLDRKIAEGPLASEQGRSMI